MAEATCPNCDTPLPEDDDGALSPLTLAGETYDVDKLSYGERNQMRSVMRELVVLDRPTADPDEDWTQDDLRLAFAIVCARRTQPGFTLQAGLALTPDELKPTGKVAGRRPTRAPRAASKP